MVYGIYRRQPDKQRQRLLNNNYKEVFAKCEKDKMKKKIIAITTILQSLAFGTAFAQSNPTSPSVTIKPVPGGSVDKIIEIIQEVGGWLLMAAGALAVVFLIIGGLQYMTSAGNADRAKAAKQTIIYALIGVAVVLLSVFLINVVLGFFK